MILLILVALAAIYWIALSIFCYKNIKRIFKKYSHALRIETPESYNAFLRMDFGKWDQPTFLRRSYTVFPLRVTALAAFTIPYGILSSLHTTFKLPAFIVNFHRKYCGRALLKLWFKIEEEFDSSELIDTPIAISNHTTWIDIYYFGLVMDSILAFVAKKEIAEMPFVRSVAAFLQCILVDRSSTEARARVKQNILERVQNFQKDPKNNYPIMIFPEGTVSNGRSIMEFKNGAFEPMCPITIFAVKYQSKQFHMGDNEMNIVDNYFMSLCANFTIRVKKQKVAPLQGETVDEYMKRCRKKISEMWGFKMYDVSVKEYFQYQKLYEQKLKELKQQKQTQNQA